MSLAREQLQSWYRQAMLRRINELVGLRERVRAGDPAALDAARGVGQALRGSGGTFGYAELSAVAALVETATDGDVARRIEGLLVELRALRAVDDPAEAAGVPEWLVLAAGLEDRGAKVADADGPEACWSAVASAAGVDEEGLARRVAEAFGLQTAETLAPSGAALMVVPETFVRERGVLPLLEDSSTIRIATWDPTALHVERELIEVTGRTPVFVIAPPRMLREALSRALGGPPEPPDAGPRSAPPAMGAPLPPGPAGSATQPQPPPGPAGPAARRQPIPGLAEPPTGQPPRRHAPPPPPAYPPKEPSDPLAAPRAPGALPPGVLVVDDDESARLLVRTLLEKRGYAVTEAADGREALDVLRTSGPFDLLLVDLDMPRMDGLELIWELRGTPEWRHVPAVVITGEQDAQLEVSMMEEGADDYIRKPLDPRLLLARVRATLRRAGG